MSDTLRPGKQAREDTLLALIEAGAMRGFVHAPFSSADDLERLYGRIRSMPARSLYVFRVPRKLAEQGLEGGAMSSLVIAGMPENVLGHVMLSFDGYADDPRELFEIPEVTAFCLGMLFGPDPVAPDPAFARAVIPYLLDEWGHAEKVGPQAFDAAGRLWVVGAAHHDLVYRRSRKSASGWTRDVGVCSDIINRLLRG